MRRGDICFVELDPIRGSEANKRRPAVIVSRDALNRVADEIGRGTVTIVPLTSNVTTVLPFQVLIPEDTDSTGLDRAGKAQAEQVRSVDVQRLGPVIGQLPARLMTEVDDALRLHLDL